MKQLNEILIVVYLNTNNIPKQRFDEFANEAFNCFSKIKFDTVSQKVMIIPVIDQETKVEIHHLNGNNTYDKIKNSISTDIKDAQKYGLKWFRRYKKINIINSIC